MKGQFQNIRLFYMIFVGAFLIIILMSIVFGILKHLLEINLEQAYPELGFPFRVFYFGCFISMGVSLYPVLIRTFVVISNKIGNEKLKLVQFLIRHEKKICYVIWFLIGVECFTLEKYAPFF